MIRRSTLTVTAVLALTVALTGCTGEAQPAPTSSSATPAPSPTPGSASMPHELGTSVEGNGWKVTVNALTPNATAAVVKLNPFNPKPEAGQAYSLVNVTIERTGDTPAHPFDVEVGIVTERGITLREAPAQAPSRIDLLAEMQPGATMTGNIAYLADTSVPAELISVTPGDREKRVFFAAPEATATPSPTSSATPAQ